MLYAHRRPWARRVQTATKRSCTSAQATHRGQPSGGMTRVRPLATAESTGGGSGVVGQAQFKRQERRCRAPIAPICPFWMTIPHQELCFTIRCLERCLNINTESNTEIKDMERFGDLPKTASDPPGRGGASPRTTHNPFPTPGILRPQKRPQRARLTLRIRALNITADGPGGCGHARRSEGPSNVKRARCESRDGPTPLRGE